MGGAFVFPPFISPTTDAARVPPQESVSVEATAIADAIEALEGGCTNGASGERGCHQYLPSTWAMYSTDVFGEVVLQTPENERTVTARKIEQWLDAGHTARDVFLFWNQGHAGPCRAGVNRHGVAYDSCAYADRGEALLTHSSAGSAAIGSESE